MLRYKKIIIIIILITKNENVWTGNTFKNKILEKLKKEINYYSIKVFHIKVLSRKCYIKMHEIQKLNTFQDYVNNGMINKLMEINQATQSCIYTYLQHRFTNIYS